MKGKLTMFTNSKAIKHVPAKAIDDLEFVRILFSVIQGVATAISSVLNLITQLLGFGA